MANITKKRGGWKRDNHGEKNPMWGKTHSIKTRKKISEINKGKHFSPETEFKKGVIHLDKRNRIKKNCIICNKEFEIKKSQANKQFNCSNTCRYKYKSISYKGRKIHTEEFKQKLRERNWKGGITPINKLIRRSEKYKQWRTAVFERDAYICIWCGQIGGILNADHIKGFADYPKLRFILSNGRTLCINCHKKTGTYGWKYYHNKQTI